MSEFSEEDEGRIGMSNTEADRLRRHNSARMRHTPGTAMIQSLVDRLREALSNEYGDDFSFIVCGNRKVIAAHTKNGGAVPFAELNKIKFDVHD